jgi:hypothetical protein
MKLKNGVSSKHKERRLLPGERMFPDEWLLQFDDAYDRMHTVARRYLEQAKSMDGTMKPSHHIEAAMLGKQFVYDEGLPLMAGFPNFTVGGLTPQAREYIIAMHEWLRDYSALRLEREATEKAEALEEHFQALLDRSLGYELSDRLLIELRGLVNELQAKISANRALREYRRERLLRRLEKLQLELHAKLSSLDRLYGTTMEVLAVAQNLGDEAKPVLDIAGKIFGIIWAVQAHKDGSGSSQTIVPFPLPPPEACEIPLPLPLPFAVSHRRMEERRF